ncbi:MAG: glycoside hydrolase family 3 N-terminal domain-containing protein [Acidobacteriota bacterium]
MLRRGAIWLAVVWAGWLGAGAQAAKTVPVYRQAKAPVELRVDDLLRRMTLEEKVRQLDLYAGAKALVSAKLDDTHAAPGAVFDPAKAEALFGGLGVGGIHDLYPRPEQANAVQAWVIAHSRLGIPAIFIEEGLHGFDKGTVFPAPIGLAGTFDMELAQETGAAIAAEMRATGVHMVLGPVLDVAREPRWGRIEEDFGEDAFLTGQMGLGYVRGAQGESLFSDHTVVAEPKHFVGHGSPEGGTNTSPMHIGERELRTVMLKSFEPAIRDGHAMGVMAAYHEIDGVPVAGDPFLLKTVLRGEMGFKGFVLSDLGAIRRLYSSHYVASSPKEASCMAVRAGVDMQFYDFTHDVFQKALIDCVHEGSLSAADLDRAVRSVLRVKFELGLFDKPMVDTALNARVDRSAEHLAVSLRSARESMTLLKNEGGLLPLAKTVKSIAVIGPNANVARYGDYEEERNGERISLVKGIREAAPAASVVFEDGRDVFSAVAAARRADVVVLGLGEDQKTSGEGHDRDSLDLPGKQEALLEAVAAAGKPVVLVLQNGRPLSIAWAKANVPAILEAWYPGEFGGRAIAETLFGDNNPAGRLAISFPQNVGQIPDFYNSDPSRGFKYVDGKSAALFPFGFGLSYTTFKYERLTATAPVGLAAKGPAAKALAAKGHGDVKVSVDVTNAGKVDGDEVVQVYLRDEVSSVETPRRTLVGFARVHLKAGEMRTVDVAIPQPQLAVWNAEKKWVVEPGWFTVWAGGSSEAALSARFEVK